MAKKVTNCKFGKQYILSLGDEDNPTIVWSIKTISNKLHEAEDLKLIDVDGIYLSIRNKKLGSLTISGKGNDINGRTTIFCQLTLTPKEETENTQTNKSSEEMVKNDLKPFIPRENLLKYREYPNLTSFAVGSLHNVDGWG